MQFKNDLCLTVFVWTLLFTFSAKAAVFQQLEVATVAHVEILSPPTPPAFSVGYVFSSSASTTAAGQTISYSALTSTISDMDAFEFALDIAVASDAIEGRFGGSVQNTFLLTISEPTAYTITVSYDFDYPAKANDSMSFSFAEAGGGPTIVNSLLNIPGSQTFQGALPAGTYYGFATLMNPLTSPSGPTIGSRSGAVSIQLVPEPTTSLLIVGGCAGLFFRRRSRR